MWTFILSTRTVIPANPAPSESADGTFNQINAPSSVIPFLIELTPAPGNSNQINRTSSVAPFAISASPAPGNSNQINRTT